MRKAKRDIPVKRYVSKGWGRRKYWEEPASKDPDQIFRFKCDKLSQEIEERLRASAKIYTNKTHSQEFLKTLVSPKSL